MDIYPFEQMEQENYSKLLKSFQIIASSSECTLLWWTQKQRLIGNFTISYLVSPALLKKYSRVSSEGHILTVQVNAYQMKNNSIIWTKSSYKEQNSRHTSLTLHTGYAHSITSKQPLVITVLEICYGVFKTNKKWI